MKQIQNNELYIHERLFYLHFKNGQFRRDLIKVYLKKKVRV